MENKISKYFTYRAKNGLLYGAIFIAMSIYFYFDNNMNLDKLQEFAQTKIKPFVSSFGIACFTMYPMNKDLWEVYSDNHKGVCLHFNSNSDPTFFHNILPMYYVPEIKKREYNPISEPDHIVDLFYKKTEEWSYEKELRLLKDKTGRIAFDSSSLLNVIVGYDAKQTFVDAIIDIVRRKYSKVNVYQTIEPVSVGRFSYKPLYLANS